MHRPTKAIDQGLFLLHQSNYDCDTALHRFKTEYQEDQEWNSEDVQSFEEGLFRFGKNFSTIHLQLLPDRTVKELVEFYYRWKRSPSYDNFVRRNLGYDGKFRSCCNQTLNYFSV